MHIHGDDLYFEYTGYLSMTGYIPIKNITSVQVDGVEYINSETGELIDYEVKKACILIDDAGKSYVTASKMFANQFIDYLMMFGFDTIKDEGLEIKIIKRSVKNSSNKALGFELV